MQFILDYFEYIVLGAFILVLVILVWNLIFSFYFSKYFSNRKFKVKSSYEIEPLNKNQTFSINIYNNNINDARIVSFGFLYKNKSINYYQTYLSQVALPQDAKIVIPSRDLIKLKIEVDQLETIISDYNKGKRQVKMIYSYVTDSLGITTYANAYSIRKIISKTFAERYHEEKAKAKGLKRIQKAEINAEKSKQRKIRRAIRKQKWDNFIFSVESKFAKKK